MSEGEPTPPPLPTQRPQDPWPRFVPVLWLMGLLLLVNLAFTVYVQATGDENPTGDCVATSAMAAIVLAFAARERHSILPAFQLNNLTWRDWALTVATFVAIAASTEAWFFLATYVFDTIEMLQPFRDHGWPAWSAVVLIVVCPAVFEEIAFRGFLLERLTPLLGRRDALLLQGALFAILHMSPVVFPSHFVIGLALGWLRLRTGSLLPCMLVHGAWNLTVLLQEGLWSMA